MQSGSGLAHWALNYEQHLHDLAHTENEKIMLTKIYKQTRYLNALNDTILNFLCGSPCNMTRKFQCLKEKLNQYKLLDNRQSFDYSDFEELEDYILSGNEASKSMSYSDIQEQNELECSQATGMHRIEIIKDYLMDEQTAMLSLLTQTIEYITHFEDLGKIKRMKL